MARGGRDELDPAVQMLVVVPADERLNPCRGAFHGLERRRREDRAVFQRFEQRLRERVVVAYRRPRERGHHAKTLHRRQHR